MEHYFSYVLRSCRKQCFYYCKRGHLNLHYFATIVSYNVYLGLRNKAYLPNLLEKKKKMLINLFSMKTFWAHLFKQSLEVVEHNRSFSRLQFFFFFFYKSFFLFFFLFIYFFY